MGDIGVHTTARYVIEIEHPSSWSPTENGEHLFDRGEKEARKILEDLFLEQRTKGRHFIKIVSAVATSVVATKRS